MFSVFSAWFFSLHFSERPITVFCGLAFLPHPGSFDCFQKWKWRKDDKWKQKEAGIFNLFQKSPQYWQSNYFVKVWLADSSLPITYVCAQAHIVLGSFLYVNRKTFCTFSWHKSFTFLIQTCSKFFLKLGNVLFLNIILFSQLVATSQTSFKPGTIQSCVFPQGVILLPAHFHMYHHTNIPILRKLPPERIYVCVSCLCSWEVQHNPGKKSMSETHPFLQYINLCTDRQHGNSLLRLCTWEDLY